MALGDWLDRAQGPGTSHGPHDLQQEIAHLRVRLNSLQQLVAELLIENERLRRS